MKPCLKNEKGFTLIELLVVIAIIGLLSSVVLASLNEARQKATNSKVLQSASQLIRAIELYASDNDGMYPGEDLVDSNNPFVQYTKKDYVRVGGTQGFDLVGDLSPYTSSVLDSPIKDQRYAYYVPDNKRCSNQNQSPRYLIIIEKVNGFESDLPTYVSGNTQVLNYTCISGPEN